MQWGAVPCIYVHFHEQCFANVSTAFGNNAVKSITSLNLPLVSSLIGAFFRSTFLCVSTSAGDLIKFVAIVKTLCRSVSVSMGANWVNDRFVHSGTQFLGAVSRLSISNTSPSVSSFSAKATMFFFGRYRFSVLLRLMIT